MPIINTGGYQDASVILGASSLKVIPMRFPSLRPLDCGTAALPQVFASGGDLPEKPCSFVLQSLPGQCHCQSAGLLRRVRRCGGDHEAMVAEIMQVYPAFTVSGNGGRLGEAAVADEMIIRTSQGNLVDDIQTSPVDRYPAGDFGCC